MDPLEVLGLFLLNSAACCGFLLVLVVGTMTTLQQVNEHGVVRGVLLSLWGFLVIGLVLAVPVLVVWGFVALLRVTGRR